MCGEHKEIYPVANNVGGSSPHVRGTQHREKLGASQAGIIPACAGNTDASLG